MVGHLRAAERRWLYLFIYDTFFLGIPGSPLLFFFQLRPSFPSSHDRWHIHIIGFFQQFLFLFFPLSLFAAGKGEGVSKIESVSRLPPYPSYGVSIHWDALFQSSISYVLVFRDIPSITVSCWGGCLFSVPVMMMLCNCVV